MVLVAQLACTGRSPNEAHKALGDWEIRPRRRHHPNVDDYTNVADPLLCNTYTGHFSTSSVLAAASNIRNKWNYQPKRYSAEPPACPHCGSPIRPDIVWFGEQLPKEPWNNGVIAAQTCDIYLVVGTSAVVQPAATLPRIAQQSGAKVIEINPKRTPESSLCDVSLRMSATEALPILRARAATRS